MIVHGVFLTGRGVSEKVSAVNFCLGSGLFGHTVQKLRVISNKCPRTSDSCFSLYGIGTSIKTLKK